MSRKKTSTFNKIVVGTTVVSMLGLGVGIGSKIMNNNSEPAHDNNTLVMHLKDGKSLKDVELLYDTTDDIEFDKVFRLSKRLPNTYIVDPAKDDDSRIGKIIDLLEDDGDVVDAEFNKIYSIPKGETVVSSDDSKVNKGFPNDPFYQKGKMWGMTAIGAEKLYDALKGVKVKRKAKVYVLDTGISQHEDLEAKLYAKDGHGHGTHCAGTIAAITNNGKGVSSLDPDGRFIELYGKKVLSDGGSGSTSGIAKAIIQSADEGADVISMSLGGPGYSKVLEKAVKYAQSKGGIVVAAAGNENSDAKNSNPAKSEGVITGGAVGQDGKGVKRVSFSNDGKIVDVSAPGMKIWSTTPKKNRMGNGQEYMAIQGTSMATPHVAGLTGMMIAVNPDIRGKGEVVTNMLRETGSDPKTESNKPIGKFINAYGSVKAAMKYK